MGAIAGPGGEGGGCGRGGLTLPCICFCFCFCFSHPPHPPGDGHRLVLRGAHLTAQEMLSAFAAHIQARAAAAAAGSEDNKQGASKQGAGARR